MVQVEPDIINAITVLGAGRFLAKKRLKELDKINNVNMYNKLYRYYTHLIVRIEVELERIDDYLKALESKTSVADFLE